MSITSGFTAPLSDQIYMNTYFGEIQTGGSGTVSAIQSNPNQHIVSTYILVSDAGSIVYENQQGEVQYIVSAPEGLFPISATKILSSGTVRGVVRTTTGSASTWFAGYKY